MNDVAAPSTGPEDRWPFARRRLGGLEVARLDCSGRHVARHVHDEFVISVNAVGRERIWLDGRSLEADTEQVTLYNPAQIQTSHAVSERWAFHSLYVDPVQLARSLDLPDATVFERPVLTARPAAHRLRAAIAAALDPDLAENSAVETLLLSLAELIGLAGSRRVPPSRHVPPAIRHSAAWLMDEMAAPPSLAVLAAEAGLTPVQMVRAFGRAYGLPPFAWLGAQRLKRARSLLEAGEPPAMVAAGLGFADQAHLSRCFRSVHGVPPGRWRRG